MTGNVDSIIAKYSNGADKLSNKFTNLQNKLASPKFAQFSKDFSNEIPIMSRGMQLMGSGGMLLGAGVTAVGAALYKSAEIALDYEKGMAKINTTSQLTSPALEKLKFSLIEIGEHSGGNFSRIPDAFEKINSQINNTNKSMEILKVANKGAQAGFVDIDLAAGALAQTMSIVGSNAKAEHIMDVLLKAKAVGAGEFKDFANYLPMLTAAASNLNIGFEQVAGTFAYMTGKGQSAADSAMLMQNMFTAFGKTDIQKGLSNAGIKIFNPNGELKAMDVVFGELSNKIGNMSSESKSAFFDAIGLHDAQAKSAFGVMLKDATKFKDVLKEINNSFGETDKQFALAASRSRAWGDLGDQLKSWGLAIGDFILPALDGLMNTLDVVGKSISNTFNGNIFKRSFLESGGLSDNQIIEESSKKNKQEDAVNRAHKYMSKKYGGSLMYAEIFDPVLKNQEAKSKKAEFDAFINAILNPKGKIDESLNKVKDAFKNPNDKKGAHHNSHLKSGIDSISGGGKTVRNVTVNIKSLVEKFEVKTTTTKEAGSDVVRTIEDYLLRAVNGAELSLTNE